MIESLRYIWQLLLLFSIICLAGILFIPRIHLDITTGAFILTLSIVTLINLTCYLIMAKGIRKGEQGGVVTLLAGIGLKFLLYLGTILAFWMVTKNLSKTFIIIFFALYLVFTFLLAIHLFKLLKNK
jgi:hypothetical protein